MLNFLYRNRNYSHLFCLLCFDVEYGWRVIIVGVIKISHISQMLQQIWEKKIPALIQITTEDVCDYDQPLPLLLLLSWNHYTGFYYQQIIDFFLSSAPFPFKQEQFHLILKQKTSTGIQEHQLTGTQIISHLFENYELTYDEPINLKCKFRQPENTSPATTMVDLKRHYKNNLKAATAIRYGKYGASRLTVEMSVNNVDDMFESFQNNNYNKYMGSQNFESDDLGYSFLVDGGEKIPVRIISSGIRIERSAQKKIALKDFLLQVLGTNQLVLNLHGVRIREFDVEMWELQKYCHPDGFIYFHI